MSEFDFVKSTYSNAGGECVEVARNPTGVVAVRDSKTPPDAPTLRLSPTAWRNFTAAR
ncbi:DUF397 domain-containing protein [Streptomyces sp. WI04-05B]|uniref:DUF397 domain-containing protein n=1 Tax=Streptomyces TaxID=1883 RepID=UPI0029B384F2|nr:MULTISPECIES: DUF397 domain-containing protein [unclassified Streptomyces]MDX2545158.1 DUF397 domain-containing protein [Streptomyces sp. WI04-05B]MDX2587272.1 DUF397 domain-containing protein [Streptomyces sp. WI04-05A]MDX3752568.1 DUF397 domain-containing protein [Streptomyces sp. AK08-02]